MLTHTFNLSIVEGMDLCEFQAILVYTVSFQDSQATY